MSSSRQLVDRDLRLELDEAPQELGLRGLDVVNIVVLVGIAI